MTLEEMMERALAQGTDTIDGGREVTSQFIALAGDGSLCMYVTPWRNEADKPPILAMVKTAFAKDEVVRYVLLSEVWAAGMTPEDDDNRLPEERPDRKELLYILGVEHGRKRCLTVPIVRDVLTGGKRRCGTPQWDQYTSIGGRMGALLPERRMAS